jgi:putative drug exporter of the RND superfamily
MLVLPILLALACLPLALGVGDRLSSGGWLPGDAESSRVDHALDDEFGRTSTAHYILFSDPNGRLTASDTAFLREIERTIAPLRNDPRITAIYTPATTRNAALRPLLVSANGAMALAIVMTEGDAASAADGIPALRETLHSDVLDVQVGGWPATTNDVRELTTSDLERAELLSFPVTLAVLVAVFGGLLLAGTPLLMTLIALLPALAFVSGIARVIETSVFTVNLVVMIGLAVGIDYALIMVTRYREELARHEPEGALAVTIATAGRTIVVSGLAVAIGLLGLVTIGVDAATSTAIGAGAVVVLSGVVSLTALPAALVLMGDRVHGRRLRVPWLARVSNAASRLGRDLRTRLDRRPLATLLVCGGVLLLLAAPALGMRAESPTMAILPTSEPARAMYDAVQANFTDAALSPMTLVVTPRNEREITSPRNLGDLEDYIEALEGIDGVSHVTSIVSFLPRGVGLEVVTNAMRIDPELAALVRPYLTEKAAVIEVNLDVPPNSDLARDILGEIRTESLRMTDGRLDVIVGGETATSVDLVDHLRERAQWSLAIVLAAMALTLFVQFRSIVLPLKAIVLNLLSLTASFGALVWIFQEGHLASMLGFEPLGYTVVVVPILMFCLMFGLSMDYEVIMLSRIREEWLRSGDNRLAIERGLAGSARIVTSAALIMLVVFAAFGGSRLQVIQQIGIGLALAILIDATLIRLVLLPAAMQLMGRWNWWCPRLPWRGAVASPAAEGLRES